MTTAIQRIASAFLNHAWKVTETRTFGEGGECTVAIAVDDEYVVTATADDERAAVRAARARARADRFMPLDTMLDVRIGL